MSSRPDDWSYNLRAGQPLSLTPHLPLMITNAALSARVFDEAERTCLQYQYIPTGAQASSAVVVASFFKNRCDCKLLTLKLQAGRRYVLTILGQNDIDLIGYYIPKDPDHEEVYQAPPLPLATKPKANAPAKGRSTALTKTRSHTRAGAKSPEPTASTSTSTAPPAKKGKRGAAATAETPKAAGKRKIRDEDDNYHSKPTTARKQSRKGPQRETEDEDDEEGEEGDE